MSKAQLYAINSEGETVLLQLSDDSPIKINLSVAELNPFTPSSFFSQTFRVPGIGPNTAFFKDVYSVNGTTFNPAAAAQAWILQAGTLFSVGNINLQSVYSNERTGLIEYEVYFLGDTSNLSTSIGEGGMSTIDTSEIDHTLSYANVTKSWDAAAGTTGGLLEGNVLYPLIEWGYNYTEDTKVPIENTLSVGYDRSFTKNANHPLKMEQLKPCIKLKWLWDKILSDAGYTYTSAFLDSDLFNSLYFVSDSVARTEFQSVTGVCNIVAGTGFTIPLGVERLVPYDIEINDIERVFNETTHTWTAPVDGTYVFYAEGTVLNVSTSSAAWRVAYYVNGVLADLSPVFTSSGFSTFWNRGYNFVPLLKGDTVQVKIENMPFSRSLALFLANRFACTQGPPATVVMNSFLPDESILKKIDFIRGIIRAFNLVLEPSKTEQKSFIIEPWIDWIQLGGIKDWTKYFDGASDTQSSPVFSEQQRILKFKGAEDEDWTSKGVQERTKHDYMYRQFDSQISLIRGEQEIDLPFGTTPMQSIPARTTQYPDWVFPSLGRIQPGNPDEPSSGELQPIIPKPRIVFYNGLQPSPLIWYLSQTVNSGVTGAPQGEHPLVSPYSEWAPDLYTTLNFNFESKEQTWSRNSTYIGKTSQDLYTRYWSQYVNWLYDPFNRKVNLTALISPTDVYELSFNDKIWVKDSWFFVSKISDYSVGESDLLKCELVKVPSEAIPGPIPTSATGGTAGTSCRALYICNDNPVGSPTQSYNYVDCDSNIATVTIPAQACSEKICALYPLINPLPFNWTVLEIGDCFDLENVININFEVQNSSVWSPMEYTTLTFYGSAGGTAGPWTPFHKYTVDGDQLISVITDIPIGFGLKLEQTSTLNVGEVLTSQFLDAEVNSITVDSSSRSGTYQPISVIFPAVITSGDTYTGNMNLTY